MKKVLSVLSKSTQSSNRFKNGSITKIITNKRIEGNLALDSTSLNGYKGQDYTKPKMLKQYGQILEIDANTVILYCLIDEEEKLFQRRCFDRQFFEGKVNLAINQFVEMRIFTRPGEVKFTFANANGQDLKEKFKPKDYFSQFEGTPLFQPLPLNINADNF